MSDTIPLSVTPAAAQFIAEMNLEEPYQKMLDNIPAKVPGVRAIAVSVQEPYDLGGGPRVIFDVTRDNASADVDPTEHEWTRWLIDTFPPEIFSNFCLLANYPS